MDGTSPKGLSQKRAKSNQEANNNEEMASTDQNNHPDFHSDDGSPVSKYKQGYDLIFASGDVDAVLFNLITREILSQPNINKNVLMCIRTNGGDPNYAYKIGKFLQSTYNKFEIYIPKECKSAGTLLACASDRIVFGVFGELGPLDVQLRRRDELFEQRSGLITQDAMKKLKDYSLELLEHFMFGIKVHGRRNISLKMASDIALKFSSDAMKTLYEKINIESLGEDERNLRVATEYCKILERKYNNLNDDSIEKLVHHYPAHDFVIDIDEARLLFKRVDKADVNLIEIFSKYIFFTDNIEKGDETIVVLI
ncbi:MAG: hypothetical protein QM537_03400 [Candidatus Symbiobacter sp.]|nr:hypothetical protein [Candidatus Symbiobacter sp.]